MKRILPTTPPLLSLVGVAIALAGLAFDVVVHLSGAPGTHHHDGFSLSEHAAHLVGLLGMVVALAGVIGDGLHRQLRGRRAAITERRTSHASR